MVQSRLNRQRKSHIGMQDAAILHIAALADMDQLIIAAQHRAEPDAGLAVDPHLADQHGVGRDPTLAIGRQDRGDAVEFIDRQSALLLEADPPHRSCDQQMHRHAAWPSGKRPQ